jgi:uncharacterized protein (TIGR02996 family)
VTQRDAFLRAIREHPDDDTPRLVYADWLDEHGDAPRAEFIRLQCRLARPVTLPLSAEAAAEHDRLQQREQELWETHGEAWWAELPELPGVRWADRYGYDYEAPQFHRGFVAYVSFESGAAFRTHAEEVFASAPVQHVRVRRLTAGDLASFLSSTFLRCCHSLELSNVPLGDEEVALLASSPGLVGLISLWLDGCGISDRGAAALAPAPFFGGLATLILWNNPIGEDGRRPCANASGTASVCRRPGHPLLRCPTPDLSAPPRAAPASSPWAGSPHSRRGSG